MAEPDRAAAAGPASASLHVLAEEVLLDLPAVDLLLSQAAGAAAAGIGLSCGITYLARYGVVTVASSDERASAVDEIQYGGGDGPCLEALRTRAIVRVDDVATEDRWPGYSELALRAGVRSSLSYPLIVGDRSVGALNVYSTDLGPWPADQEAATMLASCQATGILHAVRSIAADLVHNPDAARRLQDRHELDIATGMLMIENGCSAADARVLLTERATTQGISVRGLVNRVLASGGPEPDPTP